MHLLSVFSLRNRALIALLTIVVGIFGTVALTTLKQELFPSVTLPQLVVVTQYPGASPDVVEADVSTPIESAIRGVARPRVDDRDLDLGPVERLGVVHLRHRPHLGRAEGAAGDQPHRRRCPSRSTRA